MGPHAGARWSEFAPLFRRVRAVRPDGGPADEQVFRQVRLRHKGGEDLAERPGWPIGRAVADRRERAVISWAILSTAPGPLSSCAWPLRTGNSVWIAPKIRMPAAGAGHQLLPRHISALCRCSSDALRQAPLYRHWANCACLSGHICPAPPIRRHTLPALFPMCAHGPVPLPSARLATPQNATGLTRATGGAADRKPASETRRPGAGTGRISSVESAVPAVTGRRELERVPRHPGKRRCR